MKICLWIWGKFRGPSVLVVTTTCLPQSSSTWAGFVTRFTDLAHTNFTTANIKFRLSLQFRAYDRLWHSFLGSTLMIFQRSFKTSIACKVPIYPLSPSSGPGIICVHHQRYFQWCLQYLDNSLLHGGNKTSKKSSISFLFRAIPGVEFTNFSQQPGVVTILYLFLTTIYT